MNQTLINVGNEIQQIRGRKKAVEDLLADTKNKLLSIDKLYLTCEEGQRVAQEVARITQEKLKFQIEPIVELALETVFGKDAYGFSVEFVLKRNKTECDLYFTRNNERYTPLDSSGFGAVDVAAFALRLALWNMSRPKSRPTFILDEPMKHVSEDLQEKVMEMIKVLSDKLGIQIIMVTHTKETDIFDYSDRVFRMGIVKGYSRIKQVK